MTDRLCLAAPRDPAHCWHLTGETLTAVPRRIPRPRTPSPRSTEMTADEILARLDEIDRRASFVQGSNRSALTHALELRKLVEQLEAEVALDAPGEPDPPTEPADPSWPNRPADLPVLRDNPWESVDNDGWGVAGWSRPNLSIIQDPEHGSALRVHTPVGHPDGGSTGRVWAILGEKRRLYVGYRFRMGEGFQLHGHGHKLWVNMRGLAGHNIIDGIKATPAAGRYQTEFGPNGDSFPLNSVTVRPAVFGLGEVHTIEHLIDVDAGTFRSWMDGDLTHRSDSAEYPGAPSEVVCMNVWGGNPGWVTERAWDLDVFHTIIAGR